MRLQENEDRARNAKLPAISRRSMLVMPPTIHKLLAVIYMLDPRLLLQIIPCTVSQSKSKNCKKQRYKKFNTLQTCHNHESRISCVTKIAPWTFYWILIKADNFHIIQYMDVYWSPHSYTQKSFIRSNKSHILT